MDRLRFLLAFILISVLIVSCDAQSNPEVGDSLCIVSWNVQNLFDAKDDGTEYDEYLSSSGWDKAAYERRLSNVETVLGYLPKSACYIAVLNEIENPNVVEDIIKLGNIANMGLRWYACAGEEGGAIQTAVLSSIPISQAHVHDVGEGLRPILEVRLETGKGLLVLLAVHYKSNVGGVEETAESRALAASVTAQIAREVERENPGCLVLVCGDMNEDCWDGGVLGRDGELPASRSFGRGLWHCFWMEDDLSLWPSGSYLYDETWHSYDNIIISQAGSDGTGYEYYDAGVLFKGVLKTVDSKPNSWDRNLLKGVSDHLPIYVILD